MKKILFGSLFLMSFFSQAQIDFRSTEFGLVAGGTYSRVRNAHNPSGARISVLGGVTAQVPIGISEQYYIQAEALYVGAGEGGDRKYEDAKGWEHAVYANNYLSVPINFKVYFSEAESEFYGLMGPRFNFLVNQKIKNSAKVSYETDSYGKANSFNLGLGAGVGFSYKRQLEIALKYDIGLSDAYPDLKNSPEEILTRDPSVAKKKSEQVISLGLTYLFK
ncbi:porin family protein [Epilithonimonas zeae]|uniref:Outer membrane protein beta-barrel domain-containing protein n=1 Tax=Epilithonimonas zeae TaxID=1416779 RepID=A0A1N6EEB2_9FLAO|nr:porin family protein [Epilithonimonas zeae]SIN81359.1 Outer membrane protein beta-barrel domain-containing protein [Epilithonimonas zeae]